MEEIRNNLEEFQINTLETKIKQNRCIKTNRKNSNKKYNVIFEDIEHQLRKNIIHHFCRYRFL